MEFSLFRAIELTLVTIQTILNKKEKRIVLTRRKLHDTQIFGIRKI